MFVFLRRATIIAWATGLMTACTTPAPQAPPAGPAPLPPLQAVELHTLPGWANDPLTPLTVAVQRQCAQRGLPAPWPALCKEWESVSADTGVLRRWLERRFQAWPLRDATGETEGLITGYYEPLLNGSRRRESPSQVPLYSRPPDLLTIDLTGIEPRLQGMRLRGRLQGQRVVPYHSRSEIETTQPLAGHELVWIDDRVDAFFLEIQGSGRVRLRDGTILRVGYADQNGHPYRAIGRTLTERGALALHDVTAPAIRRWLRDNPEQATEVLHSNPSVVFFKALPALPDARPDEPEPGPPGALGVALTPERSLAVDRRVVPLGSLVWLDTRHPLNGQPLRRLMVAQDVGGAINGAVRADVFWGFGEDAERAAGDMRASGRMWTLWPRGEAFPTRSATPRPAN